MMTCIRHVIWGAFGFGKDDFRGCSMLPPVFFICTRTSRQPSDGK